MLSPQSQSTDVLLAQAASIQGLMDEENGRVGIREELTIDETPVFSTFRQNSTSCLGALPQLVEHWWGKKGQMHVNEN